MLKYFWRLLKVCAYIYYVDVCMVIALSTGPGRVRVVVAIAMGWYYNTRNTCMRMVKEGQAGVSEFRGAAIHLL